MNWLHNPPGILAFLDIVDLYLLMFSNLKLAQALLADNPELNLNFRHHVIVCQFPNRIVTCDQDRICGTKIRPVSVLVEECRKVANSFLVVLTNEWFYDSRGLLPVDGCFCGLLVRPGDSKRGAHKT